MRESLSPASRKTLYKGKMFVKASICSSRMNSRTLQVKWSSACLCVSSYPIQQDSRASSLERPWERHLSPSPSNGGNKYFAGDRQSTVYTVTCEQLKKRKLWLYAFFQQSRKTQFSFTRSRS